MNGVPEYYEVKMKQASKGIWYCDGFVSFDEDPNVVVDKANVMIGLVEKMLEKHNKEAKE